jgi:hypothetical protein
MRYVSGAVSLSFLIDERETVRRIYIWKLPQGSFIVDRMSNIGARLAKSMSVQDWVKKKMDRWIRAARNRA